MKPSSRRVFQQLPLQTWVAGEGVPQLRLPNMCTRSFTQNLLVLEGRCCPQGVCGVHAWLPGQEWQRRRGGHLHGSHLSGPQQLISQNATTQVLPPKQPAEVIWAPCPLPLLPAGGQQGPVALPGG